MEQQTYELLKRYVLGQMPENERKEFEQRLATDAAFAGEVAEWLSVYKGIQAEGDRRLEEGLNALGQKLMRENTPELVATVGKTSGARIFGLPRWAYAVAAVFLLLLLAWPVYQTLRPSAPAFAGNQAVFEQHFRTLPPPEVRDARVTAWREAYQNKNYAASAAALEQLLADPNYTGRSEANLYLGVSRLAAGQGQEALDALQQVSPESYDWDEAQWYTALAYLIVDDVVHAKPILESIAGRSDHPRQKEAHETLKSLK